MAARRHDLQHGRQGELGVVEFRKRRLRGGPAERFGLGAPLRGSGRVPCDGPYGHGRQWDGVEGSWSRLHGPSTEQMNLIPVQQKRGLFACIGTPCTEAEEGYLHVTRLRAFSREGFNPAYFLGSHPRQVAKWLDGEEMPGEVRRTRTRESGELVRQATGPFSQV